MLKSPPHIAFHCALGVRGMHRRGVMDDDTLLEPLLVADKLRVRTTRATPLVARGMPFLADEQIVIRAFECAVDPRRVCCC